MERRYKTLSLGLGCILALMTACGEQPGGANSSVSSNTTGGGSNSSPASNTTGSESPRAMRTFKEEKISFAIAQWKTHEEENLQGEPRILSYQLKASQDGPSTTTFTPQSDFWVVVKVGPVRRAVKLTCRVTAVRTDRLKAGEQIEYTLDGDYDNGFTQQAYFILARPPQGGFPKGEYRVEVLFAPKEGVEPAPAFTTDFTVQ